MRAHAGWDQFSCGAAGPVNRGDAPSSAEPAADSRIAALTSAPDTGLTLASKRKASAPERLLGIALHATLQATSAIDGPAAVAWSGSYGRRIGAIAFDGIRLRSASRGEGLVVGN